MKKNYNVESSTKKLDNTLFLEEDNYEILCFRNVEIRISENYIDIIAFSYDVDRDYPYYDNSENTVYITMSYEDARELVRLLGYKLYHAEAANISYEVPFETRTTVVSTCKREIWVNPSNNPFENNTSE